MADESPRRKRNREPRAASDDVLRDGDHLWDESAERYLLGTILTFGEDALRRVLDLVGPDDFHQEKHQRIFEACQRLEATGRAIDIVLVAEQLRVDNAFVEAGGDTYVAELVQHGATPQNLPHYAEVIRQKARLRAARSVLRTGLVSVATPSEDADRTIDDIAQSVFDLTTKRSTRSMIHIGDGIKEMIRDLEQKSRASGRGRYTGVPTGYHVLDRITNGFQPADLVILAARPGMGKTAFALNMVVNAAMNKDGPITCAVFSLEMSATQLIQRIWSFHAQVPLKHLRAAELVDDDWPRLLASAQAFRSLRIYVDDTAAISVAEVRNKCRRLKHEHNLGLVVVDYLQLMGPSREHRNSPREQQISDISRSLKGMAKELEIPVVALSQLNRGVESRPDKRPQISDLRESGAIEQDADIILMIYRASYYAQKAQDAAKKRAASGVPESGRGSGGGGNGGGPLKAVKDEDPFLTMDSTDHTTEILIEKHRAGETGRVKILWVPEFTLFANLEPPGTPPGPSDADAPPRIPTVSANSGAWDYPAPPQDDWDQPAPGPAPFDDAPPPRDGGLRPFEPAPIGPDDFDY